MSADSTLVKYAFRVRGRSKEGTKVSLHGYVRDLPDYPSSAFDKAREVCLRQMGLSRDEFILAPLGVTLRRLKK